MNANIAVMRKGELQARSDAASPVRLARIAGLLYLVIIASGIFAEFLVRQSLKVPGDAAATASNVLGAEMLFRAGIAADMVMIVADIALAGVFYLLFRAVNNGVSLLAAFFRLIQAAILGANLINLVFALRFFAGGEATQALGMVFFEAHGTGYAIALAFFAVSLLLLGYLIIKSGYVPKWFGVFLMVAAVGYLIDTLARVLLPDYAAYQPIFDAVVFGPAFAAEFALSLWLLVKGVSVPEPESDGAQTAVAAKGQAD